ncbi:MAG: hypothetical protein Q7J82_01890 [Coriobacteriia bacterium]|nr:hypothetical protein [Coriobacteriia bacterium]
MSAPVKSGSRNVLYAVAVVVAVVAGIFVAVIPPDDKLGGMVRLVMTHGALTWVNMVTFTLAGVLGVAFVAGKASARRWGEAFRWISLPLWAINTALGLLSMKLIWGGILWDEPRLWMTFGLLAAAMIVVALQLVFDRPRLTALLDAALAGCLWALVLLLPNLFHPDSPVFSSGNWAFIGPFLGIVVSLLMVAIIIATLIAREALPNQE